MTSYRKKHIKNKIHKIKPKKSILKRKWFWVVILFLVFLASSIYLLFFYSGFQVNNILISGNEKVEKQGLEKIVLEGTNNKLINFKGIELKHQSIFWVSSNKLNRKILEKFPLIEKVTIKKIFPQTLKLNVIERKPIGIYCPPTSLWQTNSQCFLLDQNGVIFEPQVPPFESYIIVRQEIENGQLFVGKKIIEQNIITAILKIEKNLKDNFQIDLEEALITNPLRLNTKTKEGWQIYFNLDSSTDINSQIIRLNLLLSKEIPLENRKKLQYIDLRFKDRAQIMPADAIK